MWPMARLHAGSVAHGAAAGSARAEVGASRLLLPARVNRHHGSPGAASRACAQPYALGACTQLRGFAAAPVAQVRADDDEAAARGFIAGGHSLADFPPERIRNFSIIAHVDHGAVAAAFIGYKQGIESPGAMANCSARGFCTETMLDQITQDRHVKADHARAGRAFVVARRTIVDIAASSQDMQQQEQHKCVLSAGSFLFLFIGHEISKGALMSKAAIANPSPNPEPWTPLYPTLS